MAALVPPCAYPEALKPIHDVFRDLDRQRLSGLDGPAPITEQDIAAWQANRHLRMTAFEVDTVRALDLLHRVLRGEEAEK